MHTQTSREDAALRHDAVVVRGAIGGFLMGLANLVPGISGGTMLLAAGVYPQFINGIAEVSTLRFRPRTLITLGCIVGAAMVAILGFAGIMSGLVVHQRWLMYSLFIGLTLGGAPLLWRKLRPLDATVAVSGLAGMAVMAALALYSPGGTAADGPTSGHQYGMYFLGGLAGASAMVLPGVSGGYLLLVLGQYVNILSALAVFKDALRAVNVSLALEAMHVLVPVGVGVVLGVVGVSNLIRLLLQRYERATLGLLLGLLLGAVIGLWPFQQGIPPAEGTAFRGDTVVMMDGRPTMRTTGRLIEPKDYRTSFFTPSAGQLAGAVAVVLLGFALSMAVARMGSARPERQGG